MNVDNTQQTTKHEKIIDAALKQYPLTPLPTRFVQQVMIQVEPLPAKPTVLRKYLRLYATELLYSTLITMVLALLLSWPLLNHLSRGASEHVLTQWSIQTSQALLVWKEMISLFPSWYLFGLVGIILIELCAFLTWFLWFEESPLQSS